MCCGPMRGPAAVAGRGIGMTDCALKGVGGSPQSGRNKEVTHMVLFVLAYLGGILTIVSPCILPRFALRLCPPPASRSCVAPCRCFSAWLPLSAVVATLAAIGGGWAVQTNEYARTVAIVLLAIFGVTLLFPALSDRVDPSPGCAGLAIVRVRRPARWNLRIGHCAIAAAWNRHRSALGALRRPGAGPDPDGCGPSWGERPDLAAARRLCRRRGNVAGAGAAHRWPGVLR